MQEASQLNASLGNCLGNTDKEETLHASWGEIAGRGGAIGLFDHSPVL